jgi:predicted phosphodiesterase
MNIQIASDLHLEFYQSIDAKIRLIEDLASVDDVDVTILAGDIAQTQKDFEMIAKIFAGVGRPVLFVYGNHEFYRASIDFEIDMRQYRDFHVMEHDTVLRIGGINFWGATMWTSYPEGYDPGLYVNDIHYIENFDQNKWIELHNKHKQGLLDCIDDVDVVITHHSPSYKSVPSEYKYSPANYCFTNDFDDIIKNSNIKLWVHGHTHNSFDYEIGQTRVVCNPYGYIGRETNHAFMLDKIIEV